MKIQATFALWMASGILLPGIALSGQASPVECDYEGVRSIAVPLYPERAVTPKFQYRFQVFGKLDPEQLVILYLPGGPGSSSMGDYSTERAQAGLEQEGLPKEIPIVFFDPRTVGCNEGSENSLPDDSLTTQHLAADVIAVIRALGLKKYILYGFSYGSQWATHVAARAERGEVPRPHALLLSGVIGRGYEEESYSWHRQLIQEWETLKSKLPQASIKKLNTAAPLGYPADHWAALISHHIKRGYRVVNGVYSYPFFDNLSALASDNPADHQRLRDSIEYPPFEPSVDVYDSERLYKKIACHEFSPSDLSYDFVSGELVTNEVDFCSGESFDRPFDSAQMLTSAPIYYLVGTNDPATPYDGARYHFENQHTSHRNVITVPGGGHNAIGAIFPDCKDAIWKAIFDLRDLPPVLSTCVAPVESMVLDARPAVSK